VLEGPLAVRDASPAFADGGGGGGDGGGDGGYAAATPQAAAAARERAARAREAAAALRAAAEGAAEGTGFGGGVLPREDFAELAVQTAIRCARTAQEP